MRAGICLIIVLILRFNAAFSQISDSLNTMELESAGFDLATPDSIIAEGGDTEEMADIASTEAAAPAPIDPSAIALLVCRPNNYAYDGDKREMGIAAVCEALLYYKLGSVSRLALIERENLYELINTYRDFGARITRQRYSKLAGSLLATHLLYSEYESLSERRGKLYIQIVSTDDLSKIFRTQIEVTWGKLNETMTDAVLKILYALNYDTADIPPQAITEDPLGGGARKEQRLAEILLEEYGGERETFFRLGEECKRLGREAESPLAAFTSAMLFARAGAFENALDAMGELAEKNGDSYTRLWVLAARYAHKSGQLQLAERYIEHAASGRSLRSDYLRERGRILERSGNLSAAYDVYRELLDRGTASLDIFIRLAVICHTLRRGEECRQYMGAIVGLTSSVNTGAFCDKIR